MTGRERIEAAFAPGGTPQLPAVICYEGIYIRDRWDELTDCPWWYQQSPDLDHQMQWRRDVVGRLGQDWLVIGGCASRRERQDVTIQERRDGVYRVDRRSGRQDRLERPHVGGWQPSAGVHSPHPERLPQTPGEVDALVGVDEGFNPEQAMSDGRRDLADMMIAEFGEKKWLLSHTASPLWSCYGLWGFEGMMTMVAERPDLVRRACERLLRRSIQRCQVAAALGADGIWIEECLTDMISPTAFAELNLPVVQQLVAAIRDAGLKSIYYYCGDPAGKWDLLFDASADALSLEESKKGWEVDVAEVVDGAQGRCAVLGNLDAIGVLEHGSRDELRSAVAAQVDAGLKSGGRFIASTGSPVTPGTPPGNVRFYCDVVRELGGRA